MRSWEADGSQALLLWDWDLPFPAAQTFCRNGEGTAASLLQGMAEGAGAAGPGEETTEQR